MESNIEPTEGVHDLPEEDRIKFGHELVGYYQKLESTQTPDDEMGIIFGKDEGYGYSK